MKPTHPLLLLTASLPHLLLAQYTIRYYTLGNCVSPSLGCFDIPSYDCCEAPPSPTNFPTIKLTTNGPIGIVIFTYLTSGVGCGGCQFGGTFGVCYDNRGTFNTAYVATSGQCGAAALAQRDLQVSMEKQPLTFSPSDAPFECKSSHKPDTATVNGKHYDVTGSRYEVIVADMLNMKEEDFAKKWVGVLRTKESIK